MNPLVSYFQKSFAASHSDIPWAFAKDFLQEIMNLSFSSTGFHLVRFMVFILLKIF